MRECPGEYSISKLLGIMMKELWEVLIDCNLAKQMGKRRGDILDQEATKSFNTNNRFDDFVTLEKKGNSNLYSCFLLEYILSTSPAKTPVLDCTGNRKKAASSFTQCHDQIPQKPTSTKNRQIQYEKIKVVIVSKEDNSKQCDSSTCQDLTSQWYDGYCSLVSKDHI
jgi:hypothetical protein